MNIIRNLLKRELLNNLSILEDTSDWSSFIETDTNNGWGTLLHNLFLYQDSYKIIMYL